MLLACVGWLAFSVSGCSVQPFNNHLSKHANKFLGTFSLTSTNTQQHHRPDCPSRIVEFGAGDGSPVISALLKSPKSPAQMPSIHAYEISPAAAALASTRAAAVGLGDVYSVHNSCFWTGAVKEGRPHEDTCLIANPPYIPAPGRCGACVGCCV